MRSPEMTRAHRARSSPLSLSTADVIPYGEGASVRRSSMTKQLSKGTCSLCHGEFSKATMTKHLEACQRRARDARAEAPSRNPARKTKKFHLLLEAPGPPLHWMH